MQGYQLLHLGHVRRIVLVQASYAGTDKHPTLIFKNKCLAINDTGSLDNSVTVSLDSNMIDEDNVDITCSLFGECNGNINITENKLHDFFLFKDATAFLFKDATFFTCELSKLI